MSSLDASCNQCGAALSVDESTRFVTCPSCKARLAVRVTGGMVLTEAMEAGIGGADASEAEEAAKSAQAAEKLQSSVKNFINNQGTGLPRPPSAIAGIISIALGAIAGGVMFALVHNGAPGLFLVFGFLFFGAGLYNGLKAIGLAMKQRK